MNLRESSWSNIKSNQTPKLLHGKMNQIKKFNSLYDQENEDEKYEVVELGGEDFEEEEEEVKESWKEDQQTSLRVTTTKEEILTQEGTLT